MTELYVDDQRVIMEPKDFKLTFENPYISSSGEYTLEVELPLDCMPNRKVFGSIGRMEVRKEAVRYKARLMADNVAMLIGTATVTQVSDTSVKLQLLGGNSAVNFAATTDKVYIDEIDYGMLDFLSLPGEKGWGVVDFKPITTNEELNRILGMIEIRWDPMRYANCANSQFAFMPIYDETNEYVKNRTSFATDGMGSFCQTMANAIQPNLLFLVRKVVERFGYTLSAEMDREPWNRIYVATVRKALRFKEVLPHWTVREFLDEVQNFLDCTFVFDSRTMTAEMVSNADYLREGDQIFQPEDTFTCELLDDDDDPDKTLSSSNIEYDMGSSVEHQYDALSDELKKAFTHKAYGSFKELEKEVGGMSQLQRKLYIFDCPEGCYVWATDGDTDDDNGTWYLHQVDQFGPLIRDEESDESISLRICPVGISVDNPMSIYRYRYDGSRYHYSKIADCPTQMLSMENVMGDEESQAYSACVWASISGEEETPADEQKEDRLQVFFIDSMIQLVYQPDTQMSTAYPMPFTDYLDKTSFGGHTVRHEPWSMSLRQSGAQVYVGQLHTDSVRPRMRSEMQITFLADSLPDIRRVFIFNNKRYLCKKYEVTVMPTGIDRIIKGYFFELI